MSVQGDESLPKNVDHPAVDSSALLNWIRPCWTDSL